MSKTYDEWKDEQKKFLEILANFEKVFKPNENAYGFEKDDYFKKIQALKEMYGIKEKYKTLREYLKEHSRGAYHHFYFSIQFTQIDVVSVEDFAAIYNEKLLDNYYVIGDTARDNGGNCENYECKHFLQIVKKED